MSTLVQIISVLGLSASKFIGAPILASVSYDFTFWQTFAVCTLGGWMGILVFVNLSDQIIKFFNRFKRKVGGKKFSWTNKLIVKTKMNFGLKGLAIITPSLLSIPLGSFIAMRYFKSKRVVMLHLSISVLLWSGLISGALHIF